MFTPFRLRELVLANRVVCSPMCQYSAEDGTPNDWHLVHLGSRAIGGAGLVMTEMTDVSREGWISPGCTGMYKPEHVAAWKRIVDFIHTHTPARVGLQLAHAGRKGSTRRLWEGIDEPLESGNWPLIAASPIPYFPHSQVPRAMDRRDMDTVREDFVRAARMADTAGGDRLARGRDGAGRGRRAGEAAAGPRLRHRGRLGGPDGAGCKAGLRPALPDAVQRPHPS